jgi:hypothetical protein
MLDRHVALRHGLVGSNDLVSTNGGRLKQKRNSDAGQTNEPSADLRLSPFGLPDASAELHKTLKLSLIIGQF